MWHCCNGLQLRHVDAQEPSQQPTVLYRSLMSLQLASLLGCSCCHSLQPATPLDLCFRCGCCLQGSQGDMVVDALHFLVRLLVQTLDALLTVKTQLGLISNHYEGKIPGLLMLLPT